MALLAACAEPQPGLRWQLSKCRVSSCELTRLYLDVAGAGKGDAYVPVPRGLTGSVPPSSEGRATCAAGLGCGSMAGAAVSAPATAAGLRLRCAGAVAAALVTTGALRCFGTCCEPPAPQLALPAGAELLLTSVPDDCCETSSRVPNWPPCQPWEEASCAAAKSATASASLPSSLSSAASCTMMWPSTVPAARLSLVSSGNRLLGCGRSSASSALSADHANWGTSRDQLLARGTLIPSPLACGSSNDCQPAVTHYLT
jgi:hypothetical protein